jgi:TonB family protein
MAISLPKPEYPAAARDRRLSGIVIVKVLIDETGKVIRAQDMCQGPPFLSESSIKAALKARFTPTKLSGMPVKVNGVIQYKFVAPKKW